MKNTKRTYLSILIAIAVLSAGLCPSHAASLKLKPGQTREEAEAYAIETGDVQRALRGKLLLTTVVGVLHVVSQDGNITSATLQSETYEKYQFQLGSENKRYHIVDTAIEQTDTIYRIPGTAGHFFMIKPYMDGKKVEAQFQLTRPNGDTVSDVRFIDVLKAQSVEIPPKPPRPQARFTGKTTGKEYFVAPDGNDANPGTIEKPFKTIEKGTSILKTGDTLYLKKGTYHEPIKISELKGEKGNPITITSYDGKAVIDGSENLDAIAAGPWEKHEGNIYKRVLHKPVWQLWKDGKMLMIARWPNITKNWTEDMDPMFNGRLPEPGTAWNIDSYFAKFNPAEAIASFKPFRIATAYNPEYEFASTQFDSRENLRKLAIRSLNPLGEVGKSFAGAVVEDRGGPRGIITKHEAGSNYFEMVFNNFAQQFADGVKEGRFVIKNHLICLDTAKEWYFDAATNTVYVMMEQGDTPAKHRYRGKTGNFISSIRESANITVKNLDFFACAFASVNSPETLVEGCTFLYPTYHQTALLAEQMKKQPPKVVSSKKKKKATEEEEDKFISSAIVFSPGGTLRDCVLEYYDSSGVEFSGAPALIENCLLHHGVRYGVIFTRSPGCVARRNTIHSTLTQGAIRIRKTAEGRFTSELNYGYDFGTWRSDASGTQVQAGSQQFHMFRRNWFHHSECKACRFDGQPAGSLGTMINNVGWRLWQGLQIKGDYQKAYNNTFVECGARHDISVINQIAFGSGQHSITRNNLCDRISGHRMVEDLTGEGKIPGFNDHNWNGLVTKKKVKPLLRDPGNFDFRPRFNPELIDKGTTLVDDRFVKGGYLDNLYFLKTDNTRGAMDDPRYGGGGSNNGHVQRYVGEAPDIGAYEYGDKHYWIPGRQYRNASFPVPPDNAQYVKTDADLMWLEGKNAVSHDVYFGTSRKKVAEAGRKSSEYMGSFTDSNILTPPKGLKKDVKYFWRVDAVGKDGTVLQGDVWSFLPCDGQYTEYRQIAPPTDLTAKLTEDNNVVLTWKGVDDERLAGYNIYRERGNSGYIKLNGEKLTPLPVKDTKFTDATIEQKGEYFYIIESIDSLGIASFEVGPVAVEIKGSS